MLASELKPLVWIGSSKKDVRKLPKLVRKHFGFALRLAQQGLRRADAKSLMGFGSGAVIEVVEDFDRSTYRAVYTVRFEGVQGREQNSEARHGVDQQAAERCGDGLRKAEERQR